MQLTLFQMEVKDQPAKNLAHAAAGIAQAATAGADMVVLPEMFVCPYANSDFLRFAQPRTGRYAQAMADAAAKAGVWLIAGSVPEQDGDRLYNTSYVFSPSGELIAAHRKMHMFDIAVQGGQHFRESDTFTPGDQVTLFDTPFGRIGLCICFDMRFPELSGLMALQGAQMILAPAAFNRTTGPAHWELLFRQRAVDNQLFTAGIAPARDSAGPYVSYAHSLVCSPWGEVLCRAGTGEEMLCCTVDFAQNSSIRAQLPLISARRTDLYGLLEKRNGIVR